MHIDLDYNALVGLVEKYCDFANKANVIQTFRTQIGVYNVDLMMVKLSMNAYIDRLFYRLLSKIESDKILQTLRVYNRSIKFMMDEYDPNLMGVIAKQEVPYIVKY